MAIAAEMLRLGVDPHAVSRAIFYERPVASLRALGSCLEALELHLDRRVSIMTVPQALYAAHSDPPLDTEGFVDTALSVEGVEVACLLKEEEPGLVSVSLRSKGPCDVDAVARRFEGGGHVKAAGCRLSGSVAEAKTRILEELAQALRLGTPTEVARGGAVLVTYPGEASPIRRGPGGGPRGHSRLRHGGPGPPRGLV